MGEKFIDADEILDESNDDDMLEIAPKTSKAWRSIERYREMQELRKHLDDFLFEDISDKHNKDLHF